jgi:glyoxylase-like metal-dependent hydrolase (beta-lactamase superfamily II)
VARDAPIAGAGYGRVIAAGAHAIGAFRRGLPKGGYSRAYLFEGRDGLALVDTCWDTDAHMILKYLAHIGGSPEDIKDIVLTHGHRSHLGGLATLAAVSGATVYCHATEAPIIRGDACADPVNLWPLLPAKLVPFRILSLVNLPKHEPWRDLEPLVDRQCVGPLTAIHTPGHTAGHMAFQFRETVMAVGDAVATWPKEGPGWPGFNRNERLYRASLWRIVQMAPEVVGPGHGDAIVENTAARLRALSAK